MLQLLLTLHVQMVKNPGFTDNTPFTEKQVSRVEINLWWIVPN